MTKKLNDDWVTEALPKPQPDNWSLDHDSNRRLAMCKLAHKARAVKALTTLCNAMYHGDLTMMDLHNSIVTEVASLQDKIEDLRKAQAMVASLDRA